MLQRKVLIGKRLGPIYARRPGPVTVEKVAALAHEAGYDAVELGPLVALRLAH